MSAPAGPEVVLPAGTVKRIHVNRPMLNADRRAGSRSAVVSVRNRGRVVRGASAAIAGPSEVVYRPDRPLSCGAVLWVETAAEVTVRGAEGAGSAAAAPAD